MMIQRFYNEVLSVRSSVCYCKICRKCINKCERIILRSISFNIIKTQPQTTLISKQKLNVRNEEREKNRN